MISLQSARDAGLTRYFTGKPCRHGHIAERQVSGRKCMECCRVEARKYYHENTEKCLARKKAWNKLHPEIARAQQNAWRARNPERARKTKNAWNKLHPEGQKVRSRRWFLANKEKANEQHYSWAKRNPSKVTALAAKRRSDKLQRTPVWANLSAINAIYEKAKRLRDAGIDSVVDHIVPLRGHFISGLHVEGNLQIIGDLENKRKSNIFRRE